MYYRVYLYTVDLRVDDSSQPLTDGKSNNTTRPLPPRPKIFSDIVETACLCHFVHVFSIPACVFYLCVRISI